MKSFYRGGLLTDLYFVKIKFLIGNIFYFHRFSYVMCGISIYFMYISELTETVINVTRNLYVKKREYKKNAKVFYFIYDIINGRGTYSLKFTDMRV